MARILRETLLPIALAALVPLAAGVVLAENETAKPVALTTGVLEPGEEWPGGDASCPLDRRS